MQHAHGLRLWVVTFAVLDTFTRSGLPSRFTFVLVRRVRLPAVALRTVRLNGLVHVHCVTFSCCTVATLRCRLRRLRLDARVVTLRVYCCLLRCARYSLRCLFCCDTRVQFLFTFCGLRCRYLIFARLLPAQFNVRWRSVTAFLLDSLAHTTYVACVVIGRWFGLRFYCLHICVVGTAFTFSLRCVRLSLLLLVVTLVLTRSWFWLFFLLRLFVTRFRFCTRSAFGHCICCSVTFTLFCAVAGYVFVLYLRF